MASLSLDYACIGFNPSQYVVIAYVSDIAPWEYREYHFSVDNPDVVLDVVEKDSKFTFYLKYDTTVTVTCSVDLFTYDLSCNKNIYYTLTDSVTIESIDDGSLFKPVIELNNIDKDTIPCFASLSVKVPNRGVPPFEYTWTIASYYPYTYYAEDDRLFLVAMARGQYNVSCKVTDACGVTVICDKIVDTEEAVEGLTVSDKYMYSFRKYLVATSGQKIFDITDIYISDSIMLEVYHNGLYMLKDLDYTIDTVNKRLIFNFTCNQNDIISMYELVSKNSFVSLLKINSKYFISTSNQTVFDITDIYDDNMIDVFIYTNGLYQSEGLDYTIDLNTKTVTFNYPLPADNIIKIICLIGQQPEYGYISMYRKTMYALQDQTIFSIYDVYKTNTFDTVVYRNGLLQVYDLDYIINNDNIQFLYPCNSNDVISVITLNELSTRIVPLKEKKELVTTYRRRFNVFKGKLSIPYNIADEDKDAILAEINLLNSYNMKHILLFNRDKASNGNFFNAIDNLDTIYSNAKYKMCATVIDQNNYLYFYLKSASDYSAKTAADRLFETIYWVMHKHGYGPTDNKIVYTYEYEPVLYSEQVVNDLTTYLEHAMQTKYNRMDLLDVHEALRSEVNIFIESLRNTDAILMEDLQTIQ